jgi:hypothetical protein
MKHLLRECGRCEESFLREKRGKRQGEEGWYEDEYKLCPECRPHQEDNDPEDLVDLLNRTGREYGR